MGEQAADVGLAVGVVARAPHRVVEGLLEDVDEHERCTVRREHGWTVCSGSPLSDKLETYRAKRSARKTPEPMGAAAPTPGGRASSSRSTTPAPALGPAPGARRRRSPPGRSRTGCPRRPKRQPPRGAHRGPPARVPRLPRRDPQGPVRRRDDDDLGPRHLRAPQVGAAQGRGAPPRRAPAGGRYALFPIDQARTPKDWMIHRMDPPADAAAASRCPSGSCRCSPAPGALPRDDGRLGLRDQVGRRARDRLLRAAAAAPARAATCTTSPPRYPELGAPQPRAQARTAPCSTARSSPSTPTGRPSFGALQRRMHVSSRDRRCDGWPRRRRSPT